MIIGSTELEKFRKELFVMLEASVMAEREACARTALDEVGGPTAKLVADKIRARGPWRMPPLVIELRIKGEK